MVMISVFIQRTLQMIVFFIVDYEDFNIIQQLFYILYMVVYTSTNYLVAKYFLISMKKEDYEFYIVNPRSNSI